MAPRVSRQSEYYGSEESNKQTARTEVQLSHADRAARKGGVPAHLLDGPGIGRQGSDPADS